jgi:hypothetical protein
MTEDAFLTLCLPLHYYCFNCLCFFSCVYISLNMPYWSFCNYGSKKATFPSSLCLSASTQQHQWCGSKLIVTHQQHGTFGITKHGNVGMLIKKKTMNKMLKWGLVECLWTFVLFKKMISWKKLTKSHMYCSHGKQLKPLNVCFLVDGSLKMFCLFFFTSFKCCIQGPRCCLWNATLRHFERD